MASADNSTEGFDGDDFSNNLFSDLGPLLALFGAEITTQFMSQTVSWYDDIILAIAPLGVVTAMVGAIRVGGPRMLRTLIGRARESRAGIEIGLLSSTSAEVCELWDGDSIVRVQGTPQIAEILLCKNAAGKWELGTRQKLPESLKDRVEISGKEGVGPPNISLNYNPPRYEGEGPIVAFASILLLGAGIMMQAYFVYWKKLKKGDEDIPPNAFPLTASGTLALTIGMFLCSYAVESATKETWYRFPKDHGVKVLWVQRAKKVNDQHFDSYAISASDRRSWLLASHRGPAFGREFSDPTDSEETPLMRPFEDDEAEISFRARLRRKRGDVGAKTGFFFHILKLRIATVFGVLLSVGGYIIQFIGIRRMHWSAAIIQLILAVVMSIVRSIERRNLWSQPSAEPLEKDHELDWLATRNGLLNMDDEDDNDEKPLRSSYWHEFRSRLALLREGFSPSPKRKQASWYGKKTMGFYVYQGSFDKKGSDVGAASDRPPAYEVAANSDVKSDVGTEKTVYQRSAMDILNHRMELARLTQWTSYVDRVAIQLSTAIQSVEELFQDLAYFTLEGEAEDSRLQWKLPIGSRREWISFDMAELLNEPQRLQEMLCAVLSLWMFHLQSERDVETDEESTAAWNLGADRDDASTHFNWWLPNAKNLKLVEIDSGTEQQKPKEESQIGDDEEREARPQVRLEPINGDPDIIVEQHLFLGFNEEVKQQSSIDEDAELQPSARLVAVRQGGTALDWCARHIFSIYLSFAIDRVKSVNGGYSNVEKGTAQIPSHEEFFDSVQFVGSAFEEMAARIVQSGLDTREGAYILFIPHFHQRHILPKPDQLAERVFQIAKGLEAEQDWLQAALYYQDLLRYTQKIPEGDQIVARSTALASEFLAVLASAIAVAKIQDNHNLDNLQQYEKAIKDSISNVKDPVRSSIVSLYAIQNEVRLSLDLSIPMAGSINPKEKPHSGPAHGNWRPAFDEVQFGNEDEWSRYDSTLKAIDSTGEGGTDLDVMDWSLLHYLVAKPPTEQCLKYIRIVIQKGKCSPNISNLRGRTPLHIAAERGNIDAVNLLVQYGAKIDAKDRNGDTPLHRAVYRGNVNEEMIELLFEKGVDLDARNRFGRTPAFVAATLGYFRLLKKFLELRASGRSREAFGMTCLHAACGQSFTGAQKDVHDMIALLISNGGNLEARDQSGRTPLHCATASGNRATVFGVLKILNESLKGMDSALAIRTTLQKGVKAYHHIFSPLTQDKRTPLHIAAATGNWRLLEMDEFYHSTRLFEDFIKANIDEPDLSGMTPIFYAVKESHSKVVRYLLDHRASIAIRQGGGYLRGGTVFNYVQNADVMDILLKACPSSVLKEILTPDQDYCFSYPVHYITDAKSLIMFLDAAEKAGVTKEQLAKMAEPFKENAVHAICENSVAGNNAEAAGEAIRALAARGYDISAEGRSYKAQPIHIAAKWFNLPAVKALLDLGADAGARDSETGTPLNAALSRRLQTPPKELIRLLSSPPSLASEGLTYLCRIGGTLETLETLLECGASIDGDPDQNDGLTALHIATSNGHMRLARALVEHGANFELKAGPAGNKKTALGCIDSLVRRKVVEKDWKRWQARAMRKRARAAVGVSR